MDEQERKLIKKKKEGCKTNRAKASEYVHNGNAQQNESAQGLRPRKICVVKYNLMAQ